MSTFGCPPSGVLTDIPAVTCAPSAGQVVKLGLQKVYSSGTTKNTISASTIDDKSTWTALKAANDGTKVIVTPFIGEPTFEAGALKEYGGGNTTSYGVAIPINFDPMKFTYNFINLSASQQKALSALNGSNLGVYLFNEAGQIGCVADNVTTPTTYYPIPTQKFVIMDKKIGGRESVDLTSCEIAIKAGTIISWVTPTDFDAANDL
jgi:hypothetical protein